MSRPIVTINTVTTTIGPSGTLNAVSVLASAQATFSGSTSYSSSASTTPTATLKPVPFRGASSSNPALAVGASTYTTTDSNHETFIIVIPSSVATVVVTKVSGRQHRSERTSRLTYTDHNDKLNFRHDIHTGIWIECWIECCIEGSHNRLFLRNGCNSDRRLQAFVWAAWYGRSHRSLGLNNMSTVIIWCLWSAEPDAGNVFARLIFIPVSMVLQSLGVKTSQVLAMDGTRAREPPINHRHMD